MLDISVENMWKEIQASEQRRDQQLSKLNMMVERYADRDSVIGEPHVAHPENHTFEYLSFMVPKVAFDNPRVSVRSRRTTARIVVDQVRDLLDQAIAQGMIDPYTAQAQLDQIEAQSGTAGAIDKGLNRWIWDSNYQSFLDRVAYDYLLAYGVGYSWLGTMPGSDPLDPDSKRWPMSSRLSPVRMVIDPSALHADESMWTGHWEVIQKSTLLEKAKRENRREDGKWNIDEIVAMSAMDDASSNVRPTRPPAEVDREEVMLYHLWVRDHRLEDSPGPEEGYSGTWLTLGAAKSEKTGTTITRYVREPRPYWGPGCGPYTIFGAYVDPDSPYPLSPLMATAGQAEELNRHVKAMNKNAAQYKRLIIVKDPDLEQHIAADPDNFVITVEDAAFEKYQVVQVEIAGITDQQLRHFELFKDRLSRMSGLTDAQRGEVQTGATATAEAIADTAGELRSAYIQKRFSQGVRRDLTTKAWMMYMDDRVAFPLGPDASEELGMVSPTFIGGNDPESDESFNDLELEIDAYSMPRTNQALLQKNVLETTELIMQMAPAMVQMPWIDWKEVLRRIGDAMNIPDLVDVINFEMIGQMAQMAEQAGVQPGQMTSADGFGRQTADRAQQSEEQYPFVGKGTGRSAGGAVTTAAAGPGG